MFAAVSLFPLPLLLPSSFLSIESARQRLAYVSFIYSVGTSGSYCQLTPYALLSRTVLTGGVKKYNGKFCLVRQQEQNSYIKMWQIQN